ncbi:stealth family protein [Atlantibacter hermannii]|uniref:stealth family protein n=1 Tax=Atlantibacter hermannii TaxID=565 RepID=UPI0022B7CC2C|nr:stealth family protein [Atlantibacter hermannii]MCZ7833613.1 Stealth CR1 domain-containing protein [Atlantibacter hermannii]
MKKIKKFFKTPGFFFRDYFIKKYPKIYNEILCPSEEEEILIRHDLALEHQLDIDFPIDVVYTWVNDKDPVWKNKFYNYNELNVERHGQYATDTARFSNHNELYFSIKSVYKNIPWVRNIYLITDQQVPEWIDEYPDIKLIDHTEIIEEKYLPTFNSHVIEAHLHNINGLAENFIYFNDDVFVARPLPKGHFFKSNGLASLFLSKKSYSTMQSRGIITPTLSASLKVSEILYKKFNVIIDIPLVHSYVPLKKSMFQLVWDENREYIESFISNKFRTNDDLNIATCLVPWYSYLKGFATIERDICYYFNIRSPVAKYYYLALCKLSSHELPHSFCTNDFASSGKVVPNYQSSLINMLNYFFSKETK